MQEDAGEVLFQPACSLDELSFEEILGELKAVTTAYRKAKGRRPWEKLYAGLTTKSCRLRRKEKELNHHLLRNLLPIAKTLTFFKVINCEPREMHFCDLRKGVWGARSIALICLNKKYFDHAVMPSVLSHETSHALGGVFFDEPLATLLGWEVDARMMRAGHKRHRTSLLGCLRDVLFHTSYLKAKSIGEIAGWKQFIRELFRNEFTEGEIDKEIKHFEEARDGFFGKGLADYTLTPYLSLKGAAACGISQLVRTYDSGAGEELDIPALLLVWKEFAA